MRKVLPQGRQRGSLLPHARGGLQGQQYILSWLERVEKQRALNNGRGYILCHLRKVKSVGEPLSESEPEPAPAKVPHIAVAPKTERKQPPAKPSGLRDCVQMMERVENILAENTHNGRVNYVKLYNYFEQPKKACSILNPIFLPSM